MIEYNLGVGIVRDRLPVVFGGEPTQAGPVRVTCWHDERLGKARIPI
ncbi:MAG: hypothetical protein JO243_06505 [Solirubrobacterales bacterium]|nr:hypothetical protein [Solirubrobacterales bacterium]